MKMRLAILIASITLGAGVPLLAHHSFAAEFDGSKSIRLTGTLTKVEWTNPHTYFYIEVKEENGRHVLNIERPILDPMATVVVVEVEGDRVER